MQPLLLDSQISDELLLEKLNVACANETEQRKNKKFCTPQPATSVSVVQSGDQSSAKCPVKEAKVKVPPEILTELAVLKTGVASSKSLSTEIAQIKGSLQQPRLQPQLYTLLSARRLSRDPQPKFSQPHYHNDHSQSQPPTSQIQHLSAPYPYRPAYAPRRYFVCQQTGINERCTHCFKCGSGEHFQTVCRIRGVRPSRDPLNRQRLPVQDKC